MRIIIFQEWILNLSNNGEISNRMDSIFDKFSNELEQKYKNNLDV